MDRPTLYSNIVEIYKDNCDFFIRMVIPSIYDGFRNIYLKSKEESNAMKEKAKEYPNIHVKHELIIFKENLKNILNWGNEIVNRDTDWIKSNTRSGEYFDVLIQAIIKSGIMMHTMSNDNFQSEILSSDYHLQIKPEDLIHKCYIECGNFFYSFPDLFLDEGIHPLKIKENQREIFEYIEKGIRQAIRGCLPNKLILKEFVENDFDKRMHNIKNIIKPTSNSYIEKTPVEQPKITPIREAINEDLSKKQDLSEKSDKESSIGGYNEKSESESGSESNSDNDESDSRTEKTHTKELEETFDQKIENLEREVIETNDKKTDDRNKPDDETDMNSEELREFYKKNDILGVFGGRKNKKNTNKKNDEKSRESKKSVETKSRASRDDGSLNKEKINLFFQNY